MIRFSTSSVLAKTLGLLQDLGLVVVLLLLSSCTTRPQDHQLIRSYLKSHYRGVSYDLIEVCEPDSAYSPLGTLLAMQHYMFNTNTTFEQQHQYIIRDDITNSEWSSDLYELILESDSLVQAYYQEGRKSMDLYRNEDSCKPQVNAKIIRARLQFNGDTIDSQFYFGKDSEIITHCIRTIESYETDLFKEYARWLRLKSNAQQDLAYLSNYHFD